MRISIHRAAVVALAITAGSFVAADVSAQGRKDAVVIEITSVENACRYAVKDVEGSLIADQQDTFFVTPGAFLNVTTIGTSARVDVKDDSRKNVPGLKNRRSATLNAGESQFFRVRDSRSDDPGSVHRVAIDCCESFTEDGTCVNPTISDKMSTNGTGSVYVKQAGLLSSLDSLVRTIVGTRSPDDPPVGSGGPDMDVDP